MTRFKYFYAFCLTTYIYFVPDKQTNIEIGYFKVQFLHYIDLPASKF